MALNELVVNMHRQPGIFALLLGSGLSRAARVPTGWDITLDLIKRLAVASDAEPDDLEAWYRDIFGREPDYSELLEQIASTEAERRGILEGYFEPDEQEREQGHKLPTAAHKAVARLVEKGYVRIILTTNFDRLIEQALSDLGIQPVVVSSSDTIRGAPPYTHNRVTLVKLHGDYKDTRIRNSVAELAAYDDALNIYLDRILDEFGLIVAGWSGDWDAALRAAMLRMVNRRYSLHWLAYSTPSSAAQELIDFRGGRVVSGLNADQFFGGMLAKLEALEEAAWSPPQSTDFLLAEVKRYLAEPERFGIRLEDLILGEARALATVIQSDNDACPWALYPQEVDICRRCVEYLEAKSERLVRVLSTVVRYDKTEMWSETVVRALGLLANEPRPNGNHNDIGKNIRLYPSRLIMTALCAVVAQEGRIETLQKIAKLPYQRWNDSRAFMGSLYSLEDANDVIRRIAGQEWYEPFAMRAVEILASWLKPLLISDYPYYDQGEFLLSLLAMDSADASPSGTKRYWPPLGGRYMYHHGNALDSLVKSEPEWFQKLFPDFREMAISFDDDVGQRKGGFRAIKLLPMLEQTR